MYLEFEKEFDRLNKSLHGFNPEGEAWFFPELRKLINKHGTDIAIDFAQNNTSPVYTTELLVKAGLRGVNKNVLLGYTKGDDEDDVYGAALSLAICGYHEGFELLNQFANQAHRLSKHIHPVADIIPDLKYINNEWASVLEMCIQKNYSS